MPMSLVGHSSLTLANEMFVLGGSSGTQWMYYSSVYKMSCNEGIFSNWTELEVHLKTPRAYFVASFIPNNLIDFLSTP